LEVDNDGKNKSEISNYTFYVIFLLDDFFYFNFTFSLNNNTNITMMNNVISQTMKNAFRRPCSGDYKNQ